MAKAHTPDGHRLSNSKKILPESQSNYNYIAIQRYIKKRQLGNCLELLEKLGYYGDSAILVLAYLQVVGGVA